MADAETKQRCTNCKCWRLPEDFIGARGIPVKRCKKCRDKDDAQKKKEHVREKRNARQREMKYYETHREKKRAEDEGAFLARNAEVMRAWRGKNADHLANWKRNSVNYMLDATKRSAVAKGLEWSLENAERLMELPCRYCGTLPEDRVNGIDRINSGVGYVPSNCVPCCKTCNMVKGCLDPATFFERCRHIAGTVDAPDAWVDHTPCSYSAYAERAARKGLEFEIDAEYYAGVQGRPCHYCRRECGLGMGIDRVDNGLGYIASNCVPCCGECNCMKRGLGGDDFLEACRKVAAACHEDPSLSASTFRNKNCMRRPVSQET